MHAPAIKGSKSETAYLRKGRFSLTAFIAWAAGVAFLVPCSKAGLESLFGLGEWLAWSGAVAVTLGGSAGAALANRRWFTGWAIAVLGYALAVSSDAVALVERLRETNTAGASVALAEVESLENQLPAIVATVEAAEDRHRAAVADAFDESRTGKGSAYAALTAKAESLADQAARARADHSRLLEAIGKARSRAAEVKAGAHWLGGVSWAGWALCGFAAAFELLVVVLAGQVWTPGSEPEPVRASSPAPAPVASRNEPRGNTSAKPSRKPSTGRKSGRTKREPVLAPYHARKGAFARASPSAS